MASVGEQADPRTSNAPARSPQPLPGEFAPPGDYFLQLLRLIQPILHPHASAVWGVDEHGVFAKVAELSTAPSRQLAPTAELARAHAKRLLDALAGDAPCVRDQDAAGSTPSSEPLLEALASFSDGVRPCGVIEVIVPKSAAVDVAHVAGALAEFAGYASQYVRSLRVASAESPPGAPASAHVALNRITLELHRHLSLSRVALTAVNEGRLLLGFDRLTLAMRRGQRTELLAISGQEQIAARSSLVQALTELAAVILPATKPLHFAGDLDALPPQLRQPLVKCMAEGGASSLDALPLGRPMPHDSELVSDPPVEILGVLIGERFDPPPAPFDHPLVREFAAHVAVALANAREMERSWTPLKRLSRRLFAPDESRTARNTAITCCLVMAAILAVGMLPVRSRVEATGRLMPVNRRQLYAPSDAQVKEVLVAGNEHVTAGQVLLRLANDRLTSELVTTRHQLDEQQQLLAALEAQSAQAQTRRGEQDSIRLSGAIAQARIEAASIQARLNALEDELRDLEIRAPMAGTVTTFDPRRGLLSRPVARGDALLEVMDTEGRWQLELEAPARRVGQILQAAAANDAAPVEFALAAEPDRSFTGALRRTPSRVVVGPNATAVAPLEVDVARQDIEHPVAGAEVFARIDCGRQPLARVLFGDFVDAVRRRLW